MALQVHQGNLNEIPSFVEPMFASKKTRVFTQRSWVNPHLICRWHIAYPQFLCANPHGFLIPHVSFYRLYPTRHSQAAKWLKSLTCGAVNANAPPDGPSDRDVFPPWKGLWFPVPPVFRDPVPKKNIILCLNPHDSLVKSAILRGLNHKLLTFNMCFIPKSIQSLWKSPCST